MPDDVREPISFGLPPQLPMNLMAEQAVLGALLTNNRNLTRCVDLKPEHFADPIHQRIFADTRKRIEAGQLTDAVTLKSTYENSGILEEVGGTGYLARLIASFIGDVGVGDYAQTIRRCWLRREALDVFDQARGLAYGSDDADSMITEAASRLLALGEQSTLAQATSFADALGAAVARADAAHKGIAGQGRLDTGIHSVDSIWRGLWPGEFYNLMARSGTGKSPLMCQIARNVAGTLQPGEHVHIFSLEMTAEAIGVVNLAAVTPWCADDIKAGNIGGPNEWMQLERARAKLSELPIVIDDQAEMDIDAMVMRARAMKRTKRTRLIMIDFLEQIRRGKDHMRMDEPRWIPFVGYQLKALAKALGVPVVALRQINKEHDKDTGRPAKRHLRYDGGEAADATFCLYRPELGMGEEPTAVDLSAEKRSNMNSAWYAKRNAVRGLAEFGAVRRRFGPSDIWAKLKFDGPRMTLSELPAGEVCDDGIPFPSEDRYG